MMQRGLILTGLVTVLPALAAAQPAPRPMVLDDFNRIVGLGDPQNTLPEL